MTDSRDPIGGPVPADTSDDPDSQTFFEGRTPVGDAGGDALGDGSAANAGYTGGLAAGTQGAAGMRQIVVDEATGQRGEGTEDEPPANLAQQDQ